MRGKIGGRTHEISRLIGRSLRAVIDYKALGENTVVLDCDVLQADGGTRTAAITGAYVALADAVAWMQTHHFIKLKSRPLTGTVAAVSVGIVDGQPLLDLAYEEDVKAETDMNVVCTGDGRFVEVQGTAEGQPFDRAELDALLSLAVDRLRRPHRRPAGRPGGDRDRRRLTAAPRRRPPRAYGHALGAAGAVPPPPHRFPHPRDDHAMTRRLVLATRNAHKVSELRAILADTGLDVELVGADAYPEIPDVKETGVTFAENALLKARALAEATGLPSVADDSGLCVDVLGGAPGIFSARWW